MNMLKKLLIAIAFCVGSNAFSQNLEYAKTVVDILCSDELAGRGYVKDGGKKAADFIKSEFKKAGLKSFGNSYAQQYGFPVVVFSDNLVLEVDGEKLETGYDFIVKGGCPKISGVFDLIYLDSATIDNNVAFQKFEKSAFYKSIIMIDGLKEKKLLNPARLDQVLKNSYKSRGLMFINQTKLTWNVATEWDPFPRIYVLGNKVKPYNKRIKIDVQPEMKQHQAENIIGYIPGKTKPDSFIVITAHYDHLGMLGKNAYFRGANDNASGVAMMMDMMYYFSVNKPNYSIAFIAFSGEEAGLFGSYYYTQNPLFPLKQIRMLINLDMMGTGDEGVMAVNGEVHKDEFLELTLINNEQNLLPAVKARGKAANSDHHFFSENGVPAFFFYLMGKYNFYHDVGDTPEALTYAKYHEAFRLFTLFIESLMD
jgi:aminopeptidase YwaD